MWRTSECAGPEKVQNGNGRLAEKLGQGSQPRQNAGTITFQPLTLSRKVYLFNAIIGSRLRYGTSSLWLANADMRRLDGFYCRGLRTTLCIPAAFVSRVRNKTVLQTANMQSLSTTIRFSRLLLLGKIFQCQCTVHEPSLEVLRDVAFHGDAPLPETAAWVRRRGRPRHTWTEQLLKVMQDAAGSFLKFQQVIQSLELGQECASRACNSNCNV